MKMKFKLIKFIKQLRAGIRRPIFKNTAAKCESLHQWTTLEELIENADHNRLKKLLKDYRIPALQSLCRGNLICRKCGHIAHYNVSLNVENLVINLRALDT